MAKPGIDQLLIQSALDADLLRRLLESPDEVFPQFDLTAEEQDLLRRPDHRLLRVLGDAFARQAGSPDPAPEESAPGTALHTPIQALMLPDLSLALTVVPCARVENGQSQSISYAVWVNPLPEGVDPATLPPPPGASLPGQPLLPLHVVIRISAIQLPDAAGTPQIGLSASLQQSTNILGPLPPKSDPRSDGVRAAVAAVRNAAQGERYGRLIDLLATLHGQEAR